MSKHLLADIAVFATLAAVFIVTSLPFESLLITFFEGAS
jgi:hypothetical protein